MYFIVLVAGPPALDSDDGNREDPVLMEVNENNSGSQDIDQNTSMYQENLNILFNNNMFIYMRHVYRKSKISSYL